jgi:plasmid stability protein
MATVTIRGLEDSEKEEIKRRAKAQGLAVEAYMRLQIKMMVNGEKYATDTYEIAHNSMARSRSEIRDSDFRKKVDHKSRGRQVFEEIHELIMEATDGEGVNMEDWIPDRKDDMVPMEPEYYAERYGIC